MASQDFSTIAGAGIHMLLRLPAAVIRSLTNLATGSSKTSGTNSGIGGKLFGWPPPRLDPSKETAWLDGLRGIAAFFVMAYHFHLLFLGIWMEGPYGSTLLPQNETVYDFWRLPFLRFLIMSGHAQVSVFFVLSGMVLSWKSLDLIRQGQNERITTTLSSAIVRRWFRLYLPCFGAGLLTFVRFYLQDAIPPNTPKYSNPFRQLWDYLLACEEFSRPLLRDRQHPNWLHRYTWITWTIPLEFEGSMLVFVCLMGMARIRSYTKRLSILSFICVYACVRGYWTYWLFATGMLIADYVKESGGFHQLTQQTTSASRVFWWSILALGIWMAGIPNVSPKFYDRPGYEFLQNITPPAYEDIEAGVRFWWSLAGILILLSFCHLRPMQEMCETSLARYLGRLSFMLYITHDDIPRAIAHLVRKWYGGIWGTKVWNELFGQYLDEYTTIPGLILYCLSWITGGIPAIILANWCEVLLDQPSVRYAKWIEMKLVGQGSDITPPERQFSSYDLDDESAVPLSTYRTSNSND